MTELVVLRSSEIPPLGVVVRGVLSLIDYRPVLRETFIGVVIVRMWNCFTS